MKKTEEDAHKARSTNFNIGQCNANKSAQDPEELKKSIEQYQKDWKFKEQLPRYNRD